MAPIGLNIVVNVMAQGWSTLMLLAFVPLYIKFLGIESYGLIGFYATLHGTLKVLDMGLSSTVNRELSRYSAIEASSAEMRTFVRTLEVGYWAVGIAVGGVVYLGSSWIAEHWIKGDAIPAETIRHAVTTMGVLIALQWPVSFYQGGLLGLDRHVVLNSVKIGWVTLSSGGAVLVLWLISPTIEAFLLWQVVISAIHVLSIALLLWRALPGPSCRPRVAPRVLKSIRSFAFGMSGIGLSALLLSQIDKVIVSALVDLKLFGYYVLACTVSNGLDMFVSGVYNALFPRFSALVVINDEATLRTLYHKSTQLMGVLIVPATAILAFFSYDIMVLWTGSVEIAQNTATIISILVIATCLRGLMTSPYALQLAYGWTSLGVRINVGLIVILVPSIVYMATNYGGIGAAVVMALINGIYMILGVPLTHSRLLRGEGWPWIRHDVVPPIVAAVVVALLARWVIVSPMRPIVALPLLSAVLIGASGAAWVATRGRRLSRLVTFRT